MKPWRNLSKVLSLKEKTKEWKIIKESPQNRLNPATQARQTAVCVSKGNCAPKHGRWHDLLPCDLSGPTERLCHPVHDRTCLRLLSFALSGLRLTTILPSIPLESYLSHQNLKVLPENIDKPQYKHNWIKGSKSIPFSSRFIVEIRKNKDQIRLNKVKIEVYHYSKQRRRVN